MPEFGLGIAFSRDGKLLATLNDEGKIVLLSPLNGKQIKALGSLSGALGALSFSRDDKLLGDADSNVLKIVARQ